MSEISGTFQKSPGGKKTSLTGRKLGRDVDVGGEGVGSLVRTNVKNRQGRERPAGQFFVKQLAKNYFDYDEIKPENTIRKYLWLKQRGFPVVPTMRYDSAAGSFIMTDLTEGGKNLLVDRHFPLPAFNIAIEEIDNWREISQEIRDLAIKIFDSGNGMAVDDDNYALILKKLGNSYKAKIYLLDLGFHAYILADGMRIPKTLEDQLRGVEVFLKKIQGFWVG